MVDPVARDVTIICKTFERPASVAAFIASVRRFYPDLKIVVADDSRAPTVQASPGVEIVRLPYDSGLAAGRNAALARVETPYFVVCDDDFVFCSQTRIERLLEIARTTRFRIVGGMLMDHRRGTGICRGRLQFAGTLNVENGVFYHRKRRSRGMLDGLPHYDLIVNFFLAECAAVGPEPWDGTFKIGHEHGDFFLSMRKKGVLITEAAEVWVEHYPNLPLGYAAQRQRSGDFEAYFFQKWGLKEVRVEGGPDFDFADKVRFGWPSKFAYALRGMRPASGR